MCIRDSINAEYGNSFRQAMSRVLSLCLVMACACVAMGERGIVPTQEAEAAAATAKKLQQLSTAEELKASKAVEKTKEYEQEALTAEKAAAGQQQKLQNAADKMNDMAVSYTHLRAHETPEHLVCRLLLEKKKKKKEKKDK
eukprot:TRINITY_DN1092_c0_g1_i18.p2 TRINITY_DN1092_c0_g1~~TRINITY_DN1092_c0_g1_i18.p2  ORF type:complete len:141 (-),score=58.13 TRINITY_DN1092_c0_g1_i18:42-464(-)